LHPVETLASFGVELESPIVRTRRPIAPDEYHKDNVSGGAPDEIHLPNSAMDAELENEWHETSFVEYLRVCFKWGGFPGFERVKTALYDPLRRGREG
jgi:hypothetical protein